jgi:chromosome segregation protein
MLLKSIELFGFKSFAKKSVFEFNSRITAIVGPNGSGKSNVAEAFSFVLGEQSIKSMRGKKGEDLIWNGGEGAPRTNRASVKVVFDNTKKFLNVDFPEVYVERVVHRDGVNEYSVNGSQVRLRDIIELLAAAHIGASGHHIISQGEADRVLSSNIKERREMIEDALGLKIYQYKRQESERKLEKTLENIKQVQALRKEISPHLRFLKKQVERIEKMGQLKEELVVVSREYLKRESLYLEFTKNDIALCLKPLEKQKTSLEKELSEAKSILEKSKNKDEKREQVIDLEKKIHETRKEKDTLLQNLGKIQGEISAEERIIQKQKEISSSNEHKTIFLKDVEELGKNIEQTVTEIEKNNDISLVKKVLRDLLSQFQDFIRSKREESDESLIKESQEMIGRLTTQKANLENSLKDTQMREDNFQEEYEKLQKEIEKEKDSNRDAEKFLFRIMSEENRIIGEINAIRAAEERLRVEEEDFKREREECALLGGRFVLDYENLIDDNEGNRLNKEGVSKEDRHLQEERRRSLEKIKIRLEDSGVSGGEDVMKEYQETNERETFLSRELEDLEKSAASLKQLIADLGQKLDQEFKIGISKINAEFQKFFEIMFGGGNAELRITKDEKRKTKNEEILEMSEEFEEITDEKEASDEGVDIHVSLPRKKIKGLMMLSGGERALTSIALIFAMSQVNPPPFIILDETDAALDEANSKKYGDMIESLSQHSQLILITHNRETMSRAGVIYGVTMDGSGVSKMLSIQFEEAVVVAK